MNEYKYSKTNLPPEGMPFSKDGYWRLTPDLPFWWFLNPWKTVEDLQDSLLTAIEEANEWHEKHQQADRLWSQDVKERDEVTDRLNQQIYDLQNELETTRSERDAANDAVHTLRKKKKGGRK